MFGTWFRATLTSWLTLAVPAVAADLSQVDRTLARQPAYQTQTPRYALVVFGAEAASRHWLVADGHSLYVDRNGNGDLTESGEQVVGTRSADGQVARFLVGGLSDWDGRPAQLQVVLTGETDLNDRLHLIREGVPYQSVSFDEQGSFRFALRPEQAPIVHFGGPLHLALRMEQSLRRGTRDSLMTMIGTPGLGEGSFAALDFPRVPGGVHPVAEIVFPGSSENEPPRSVRVSLSKRCCTCNFQGDVRIPNDLKTGSAEVTLSLETWPQTRVAPATFRIPIK
jgi:hypothetical protein